MLLCLVGIMSITMVKMCLQDRMLYQQSQVDDSWPHAHL